MLYYPFIEPKRDKKSHLALGLPLMKDSIKLTSEGELGVVPH